MKFQIFKHATENDSKTFENSHLRTILNELEMCVEPKNHSGNLHLFFFKKKANRLKFFKLLTNAAKKNTKKFFSFLIFIVI